MGIGAIYIVLGVTVLLWGRRLFPGQLRRIRSVMAPARQESFDALLREPGPRRVFATASACGVATVVVGVVLLVR
jgi:hypothetical protein